ncbi:enoyl-CoA hydratase [Gilvimarinus agarilyticus]|uniref:enoyl-CoA hydratase n=1 Tax=unclassified Gilvimarinus TaxID=2642066 RepID=UPI001C09ADBE|nr:MULTISPECIES: enoyl-CoA hydratase [unclassified Gilvimarinus]MBU2884652.1 enoyl-CoA hydratase [Gilvimarinus agarilyticus]MDO6569759.1 enoyl-CoA hydratase [Gilvimarinus sp. 2_MG-2023]MDO6747427.1 enoyl-CoA hydratase [Gilvimarinus sp. 1_MG-2023]
MTMPFEVSEQVKANIMDGVLRLQLNRPQQKNALSLAMYQSLANALQWAATSDNVRVVCLAGSEDSFTAGNDLADFLRAGQGGPPVLSKEHPVIQFMHSLRHLPQPIVAEVNGMAIGIGTTLLLHCDFVYAADDAYFQLPFARLGLCPEFASSALLVRRVGEARAKEMLLLGEAISAGQALGYGLLNGVFPRERLGTEVDSVCQTLALRPPQALRRSKALINQVVGWPVDRVIERELEVFSECLGGEEAQLIIKQATEEKT